MMIDTNVIVSAVYNPKSKPADALGHVCENHDLVLCDHIIAECYNVVTRKFPQHFDYAAALRAVAIYSGPNPAKLKWNC
jgi:predicted nucleic acid-binding protein